MRVLSKILQSELKYRDGFTDWYRDWQQRMKEDELLKRFVEGRNIVVHTGMLQHRSRIKAGVFRGNLIKLAFDLPITIHDRSEDVLLFIKENFVGPLDFMIDEDQQLGVQRTWIVDDLGDGNEDVVILCHQAWSRISQVVSAAHEFMGATFPSIEEKTGPHDPSLINTLFDSTPTDASELGNEGDESGLENEDDC
jgi:hypothetical protein